MIQSVPIWTFFRTMIRLFSVMPDALSFLLPPIYSDAPLSTMIRVPFPIIKSPSIINSLFSPSLMDIGSLPPYHESILRIPLHTNLAVGATQIFIFWNVLCIRIGTLYLHSVTFLDARTLRTARIRKEGLKW